MKILFTITLVSIMVLTTSLNVEKTAQLVDNSKVLYNISDGKILEGAYLIKDVKDVTRLRGAYTKNIRSGNWYCFDANGKMVMRYNYDLKKLISLEEAQLDGFTINIIDNDPEVVKNASVPIPVCSMDQLKAIIIEELKNTMPARLKAEGGIAKTDFTIKINEKGEAKYFAKYVIKNLSYENMVFIREKVFKIEWIPSLFKNKTYKSEIAFGAEFNIEPGDHRRFIWNQ